MLVDLPAPGAYAALVLAGLTQTGANEQAEMAVVLKAAYDMADDGSGVHDLVPAADPARAALVLADEGRHLYTTKSGNEFQVPAGAFGVEPPGSQNPEKPYFDFGGSRHYIDELSPPESLEFDLVREADLALDKAVCDVVVESLAGPAPVSGAVRVDGAVWLTRSPETPTRRDTGRNLFGWQGRGEKPRSDVLADSYDQTTDGAIPTGDTADFNNVYRRSTGFHAPGSLDLTAVPAGALVEVFRNETATGTPAVVARLPGLVMGMRLRVYCGHGPDLAPRWRIVPRADLTPDTLVLRPAAGTAEILWRGHWPAALHPRDRYRAVQIRAGGF